MYSEGFTEGLFCVCVFVEGEGGVVGVASSILLGPQTPASPGERQTYILSSPVNLTHTCHQQGILPSVCFVGSVFDYFSNAVLASALQPFSFCYGNGIKAF